MGWISAYYKGFIVLDVCKKEKDLMGIFWSDFRDFTTFLRNYNEKD